MTEWDRLWNAAHESIRRGAMQNAFEFAHALRIASEAEVRTVLEIGSARGGSLYGWRKVVPDVLALTLPDDAEYGQPDDDTGARIGYFDSHTAEARDWLTAQLGGGQIDLLFIDGDHSFEGCSADYRDYRDFVRPGGMIMIHDIAYMPDVIRFWAELDVPKYSIVSPVSRPIGIGVIEK